MQLPLHPKVNYGNKSTQITAIYFQGTRYRVYGTAESNKMVKIYDNGQDRFLRTELQAISVLKQHPNILTACEGQSSNCKVVILEKANMLQNILRDLQRGLSEPQILKILLDLCRALKHSHLQGVTHRDIRPENVVIGLDEQAKLWNFQRCSFQSYAQPIPLEYRARVREELDLNTFQHVRAPEQNDPNFTYPITEKVDIYALGQLVYYMIYNVRYDQNPHGSQNPKWGMYSDRLQQLVRMLLTPNPNERMNAEQVESYISTQLIVQNSLQVQIRSRSSNEKATKELASQRSERDKFDPIEFVEIESKAESTIGTKIMNKFSKFTNKTDLWIAACLDEVDTGPKQKYLRYLVVKAWQKKEKISKFYLKLSKRVELHNIIICFKALQLIHNYTKKGPIDTITIEHKEYAPIPILMKINTFYQSLKLNPKDKLQTSYLRNIMIVYSEVLMEKMKLCNAYKNILEGSYAVTPFFNNFTGQHRSKITIALVQNILDFWSKLISFSESLLKEQTLINLQFNLCILMIDELFSILSLSTHLIYTVKQGTNYTNSEQNPDLQQKIRIAITNLQQSFILNYQQTTHFLQLCYQIPQLSSIVPQPSKNVLDIIKNIPILEQNKGEFNIFEYFSYSNTIDGIRLPQSYGEKVSATKIEDDDQETLKLEILENSKTQSKLELQKQIQSSQSIPLQRDNRFTQISSQQQQQYRDNRFSLPQPQQQQDIEETRFSLSQFSNNNNINNNNSNHINSNNNNNNNNNNTIKCSKESSEIKVQKKPRNSLAMGEYQDISSDEDDMEGHHTPDKEIKPNLRDQLAKDDFLALPSPNGKPQQNPQKTQQFGFDNLIQVQQVQLQQQSKNIFDQFVPQIDQKYHNYFKPQQQQFEIETFMQNELKKNNDEWIIPNEELIIDKQIGTGSSCVVYKGSWRGSEVAIKKMKLKSLVGDHLKEFKREITAFTTIHPHQNLVHFIGLAQKEQDLYIITEFCSGGTLFDLLHKRKHIEIPWSTRVKMALQIAQGMQYLHQLKPPLIHRDLKSLNLLLENQYDPQKINLKIVDFGLARAQLENDEIMTGVLGTFHWMAPEIFNSAPYSIQADVFSYGIVLWEICSRETPYKAIGNPHAIMKYVTIDKGRPDLNQIQNGCPAFIRELMIRCWDQDANKRPKFVEVVNIIKSRQQLGSV